MNKYEIKIVNILLKKYYKRQISHRELLTKRRIDLPVNKILKNYSEYNVNLNEKEYVNKAINILENNNFITSSKLKYSEDYEKIYLCIDKVRELEEYAANNLGITPRSFAVNELQVIIKKYKNKGKLVDNYISILEDLMQTSSTQIDVTKEEDILKILMFLENNKEYLYTREASMIIFGDSKYLENNRKTQVNNILMNYLISHDEESFEEENLFERFNVYDTDQDICIKGPVTVVFNDKSVNIDGLSGGVSFSIKDINKIKNIVVDCDKVMTIENKTSFLRMNEGDCYIYLGGFATKSQIKFINILINNNPNKEYYHFGDIDAGGFWIHKKLCEQTNKEFKLFCMNKDLLKNKDFKACLRSLSDNDISRLNNLKDDKKYYECIKYMLDNNCKLEQEIVSLFYQKNK